MTAFVKIGDTWIETESIESITAHVKPNYHAANLHTVKIITKSGQTHCADMFESQVTSLLEVLTGVSK